MHVTFVIYRPFIACLHIHIRITDAHTRLQVKINHGPSRTRRNEVWSCPPPESSEAKIHVLLTVTGMIEFFMLHCALPHDMPLQSAHYTFKFSGKLLTYIVTQ